MCAVIVACAEICIKIMQNSITNSFFLKTVNLVREHNNVGKNILWSQEEVKKFGETFVLYECNDLFSMYNM